MLDKVGAKHRISEIGLDKVKVSSPKRIKSMPDDWQVGTAASEKHGEVEVESKKSTVDGYAILDVDFREISERSTSPDRTLCLAALDRGDESSSKSKLHKLVLRDDVESVKIILDHPKSKAPSFQLIKDICLAESVEDLNISMAKVLLSSGASPSSISIRKNAFQYMQDPNLGRYSPDKLEAMKKMLQKADHVEKPSEE